MIEEPFHVGELHWVLLPYYGLTNVVAAIRAYQLNEINIIIRLWMVVGLVGGAHGHTMDFIQVLKDDNRLFSDVIKASKKAHVLGMVLLAFPSLLGIYAMAYLYITNVSGWSMESYVLAGLVCFTLGWDLYYTMGWGTSFQWHKNHVLAHCVFLISEYTTTGYFSASGGTSFTFFGIQLFVAVCLEILLFFPGLVFQMESTTSTDKARLSRRKHNNVVGIVIFMLIFGSAISIDYIMKLSNPFVYIPRTSHVIL